MKKLLVFLGVASLLVVNPGCKDYLDVNHDPNVVENIKEPKIVLSNSQMLIATQLMGWDLGFIGAFWTQYWTQKHTGSQFKGLSNYSEVQAGSAYEALTSGALQDLNRIKDISADHERYAGYAYIAEILSIFTWQVLTDTWGDIPYFEAQKGAVGIIAPKFDKGEDIYVDLIRRIDALLAQPLPKVPIDARYDFLCEGDYARWRQLANGLKLKLMLRQSETAKYDNSATLAFVESTDFIKQSVLISGSTWEDSKEGKRHPLREFEEGGANYFTVNVIGCASFIEYLKVNSDPRLKTLFTDNAGVYRGAFFGDYDSTEKTDGVLSDKDVKYSRPIIRPDLDLMLMSLWEVNFNIAEVYARAGNALKAKDYYEKAVKASLAQHGINDQAILVAGGYATWDVAANEEDQIKQIAMQRWVANANYQHAETFFERNRLKYPSVNEIDVRLNRKSVFESFPVGQLTISVSGRERLNLNLPKSLLYPNSITERNSNALPQKPNVGQKIWWDQKPGK
ncbi:MAG: SusD/RagB family nutrient-binding outer membrane lipoprotein [Porphyromonadaceae bacterium]|nr:SusD/RagB family nutrient-binding outer membrane lipoprotein [Porphyromonadaceae bacterium]